MCGPVGSWSIAETCLGLSGGPRGIDERGTVAGLLLLYPPLNLVVRHVVTNLHELGPRHDSFVSLLSVDWVRGVLDYGLQMGETVTHLWGREGEM